MIVWICLASIVFHIFFQCVTLLAFQTWRTWMLYQISWRYIQYICRDMSLWSVKVFRIGIFIFPKFFFFTSRGYFLLIFRRTKLWDNVSHLKENGSSLKSSLCVSSVLFVPWIDAQMLRSMSPSHMHTLGILTHTLTLTCIIVVIIYYMS